MLVFDGFDFTTKIIKLRPKQADTCAMCKHSTCGDELPQRIESILDEFDYNQFCGVTNYNDKSVNVRVLGESERISGTEYKKISEQSNKSHILIDTRPKCQFQICSLPNSLSIYI